MQIIAVTGPRKLTLEQHEQALRELNALVICSYWHVGDATGLDALALEVACSSEVNFELYQKKVNLPYRAQGAERSTRMVKALAAVGGTLHAWPNKPAPLGLKPSRSWPKRAQRSGTWGTIALAVGLGLPVELHPLSDVGQSLEWLETQQLSLI
ncbi:MAG: hypothetical protein WA902_09000 [Thermosynechococcaceae cyanobacterium]